MTTEENNLPNEAENKTDNNEQEENKNKEQNIKKTENEENEEKEENQQNKEEKSVINDNELENMKYEIINEDSQQFDLSFKIIVIGDSGKKLII